MAFDSSRTTPVTRTVPPPGRAGAGPTWAPSWARTGAMPAPSRHASRAAAALRRKLIGLLCEVMRKVSNCNGPTVETSDDPDVTRAFRAGKLICPSGGPIGTAMAGVTNYADLTDTSHPRHANLFALQHVSCAGRG